MEHTTLLRLKENIRKIWHKKYLSFEARKALELFIILLCNASFVSGCFIFFVMGGVAYEEERPKELTYAQNICEVHSTDYKEYRCYRRPRYVRCYAPIWDVVYGEN